MNVKEALVNSTIQTFSDMAFLEVIENFENNNDSTYQNIVLIEILKPTYGSLYLLLPNELKNMITKNIYGDDFDNLKENDIDDCLLEILNVLAGNFLTSLFGNKAIYKIELPQVLIDFKKREDYNLVKFNAEGIKFEIFYIVENYK
ncbi:MAG: hypothetical protein A2086_05895 [Spirochaetes bacterium GWD1_27_9]|nr:MAG: hypothetical protein A2Z98_17695 [Spirochaetes bacterium GWB1_27_13]OHD26692.1 MAG: hypothetical protein A2Y34_01785 [Spirochaetes bacterium GWC1_27_15]OHD35532.1 MAG: hypothetical protein A2086_05895 [Spirochaetes bacterium GWD1_27_9]